MSDAMTQLYQQLILDHSRERHGYGLTGDLDAAGVAESFQVNPTCGDEVRLRVQVEGDVLSAVTWEGVGCSISQASTSVLTDLVTGADLGQVRDLAERFHALMHSRGAGVAEADLDVLGDAAAFEGVSQYPARVKCALLGWMALQDALIKTTASSPGQDRSAQLTSEGE